MTTSSMVTAKETSSKKFSVKFYESRGGNSRDCYDGGSNGSGVACFGNFGGKLDGKATERLYPDEYLINAILRKFLFKIGASEKVCTIAEPWAGSSGGENTRAGNANTKKIHDLVIADSKHELILVPYLLGYHHPGVVVDKNKKTVIYMDPFGSNSNVEFQSDLLQKLPSYSPSLIKSRQQQNDGTSCGPICTHTMMEFAIRYLCGRQVSADAFESPRKKLATDRMFQMYINNNYKGIEEKCALNFEEAMFAAPGMMREFLLVDQKVDQKTIIDEVVKITGEQRDFIKKNARNWLVPGSLNEMNSYLLCVNRFQSRITELVILGDKLEISRVIKWWRDNENQIKDGTLKQGDFLPFADLLSPENFAKTQNAMRFSGDPYLSRQHEAKLVLPVAASTATTTTQQFFSIPRQGLPLDVLQSSRSDNDAAHRKFWTITLPGLGFKCAGATDNDLERSVLDGAGEVKAEITTSMFLAKTFKGEDVTVFYLNLTPGQDAKAMAERVVNSYRSKMPNLIPERYGPAFVVDADTGKYGKYQVGIIVNSVALRDPQTVSFLTQKLKNRQLVTPDVTSSVTVPEHRWRPCSAWGV